MRHAYEQSTNWASASKRRETPAGIVGAHHPRRLQTARRDARRGEHHVMNNEGDVRFPIINQAILDAVVFDRLDADHVIKLRQIVKLLLRRLLIENIQLRAMIRDDTRAALEVGICLYNGIIVNLTVTNTLPIANEMPAAIGNTMLCGNSGTPTTYTETFSTNSATSRLYHPPSKPQPKLPQPVMFGSVW